MSANQLDNSQSNQPENTIRFIDGTGRTTEFFCPRCLDQQLEVGTIFKFQVCFCSACQGFVIDSSTLGRMIHLLRAGYEGPEDKPIVFDQSQLHKEVCCPTCLERMETHPYYGPGNVVLDSCSICKLSWLDNHELATIMRAPGPR